MPANTYTYHANIRKIDRLFVAGKMEPIMRMPSPEDQEYYDARTALENYLLQYYLSRSK